MGREIRKVPPNWSHPRDHKGNYISLLKGGNNQYESRLKEWKEDKANWSKEDIEEYGKFDENQPVKSNYTDYNDVEPTWFQIYQTVSEGYPVSPPFETKAELVEYLITNGDFWDQNRGDGGWERKYAEQFVERGFAFSGMFGESGSKTPRTGS